MSTNNAPVGAAPVYSQVAQLSGVPDGDYMLAAQIWAEDSGSDTPDLRCHVSVNGSELSGTDSLSPGARSEAVMTIVSADAMNGGGNSVSVFCLTQDNTTTANVNLSLTRVDALN